MPEKEAKKGSKVEIIAKSIFQGCTAAVLEVLKDGRLAVEITDVPVDPATGEKKVLKAVQGKQGENALETREITIGELRDSDECLTTVQPKWAKVLIALLLVGAGVACALGASASGGLSEPSWWALLLPLFGAVTVTNVLVDNNKRIDDVEATADADVAATIAHGFGAAIPQEVSIVGLAAAAQLSLPVTSTIDATNVIITMTGAVGSGAAGAQFRVTTKRRGTP